MKKYVDFLLFFCFTIISFVSENSSDTLSTTKNVLQQEWNDEGCEILLESFAFASSNYTFCAIYFARPIKLCQLCVDKFQVVERVYRDILTLENDEGQQCQAKLINLDRLQVVKAGFEYVTGLWKRANCNKCFEIDEIGHPTKTLTDSTKEILKLSSDSQACIEKYHNQSSALKVYDPKVCTACKDFYLKLNTRYDALKDKPGFCMDIVDLMNSTRAQWSTELKCCMDREHPQWLFLISSYVFACLPATFYLAAYIFGSHKEQTVIEQRRLRPSVAGSSTSVSVQQ